MNRGVQVLLVLAIVLALARPSYAFGAGNIVTVSKIEGKNWRHGDIEDTLLELAIAVGGSKFSKLNVKRVYFGNWLRDYSQAIDVGGLKQLSAENIRLVLSILAFLTFGFATDEFEVTKDRLGCYRPEEHIDNPKDYADNDDARKFDDRLRGPVDEGKELAIDTDTGLKVYIASENRGADTSAGLVRRLLEDSINLGRKYRRDKNKSDQFESLRKLGTALHCLEDFSAHSNYTELALKELGVDAFAFVGDNTQVDVRGKRVFPLVTGTFGTTDFLHSVVGEVGDKVAQSEVEALESQLDKANQDAQNKDQFSIIKSILDKIPWSMLEGGSAPDTNKAEELKAASEQKAQEGNPFEIGGVSVEDAKKFAIQTSRDIYPILEWHDKIMKAVSKIVSIVPGLDSLFEDLTGALTVFCFSLLSPYIKPIIAHSRAELKSGSEGILKSSMKGQYQVFDDGNCSDPTHSMLSKDHFSNILNPIAGQIASTTVKFVVPLVVAAWADEGKDIRQVQDEILQVFHHPALRDENKQGQRAMFETVKNWWESQDRSTQDDYRGRLSKQGVRDGRNHRGEGAEGSHGHGETEHKKSELQVNAESTLSGLAGGLVNMVLGKSSQAPAATTQQQRPSQHEEGGYGQSSYSQPERQENTSSYGRQENTSSYGRQENTSSYGSGRQETSSYGSGRQDNSYGRSDEYSSSGRTGGYGSNEGSGRQEASSYGRSDESSGYGSGRRQDNSGYGQQSSEYGGGRRQDQSRQDDDSSYGRQQTSSYGRSEESSGYGRQETSSYARNEESSGYGGRQQTSSYTRNDEGSGYGRQQQQSSYGRNEDEDGSGRGGGGHRHHGRKDDDENEGSYGEGRRRNRGDDESESYGGSGGRGY